MQPCAAVARGHDRRGLGAPGLDHAVDRGRVELRPVAEHDDRGFDVVRQRSEPAAKRGARATLPVGAADGASASSRARARRARRAGRPLSSCVPARAAARAAAPAWASRTGSRRRPPARRPRSSAERVERPAHERPCQIDLVRGPRQRGRAVELFGAREQPRDRRHAGQRQPRLAGGARGGDADEREREARCAPSPSGTCWPPAAAPRARGSARRARAPSRRGRPRSAGGRGRRPAARAGRCAASRRARAAPPPGRTGAPTRSRSLPKIACSRCAPSRA